MLKWGQWIRSEGARHHMDINTYEGKSFSGIFYDAMKLVFTDKSDTPGLIAKGLVMARAEGILQNQDSQGTPHPLDPVEFTKQDMEKMLYYV